jgi:DNA-binding beta-propeller fold protein YncE/mono/diheme cytochrome c family protein
MQLLGTTLLGAMCLVASGDSAASGPQDVRRGPTTLPFETPEFSMVDAPVGATMKLTGAAQPWLSGSTIAGVGDGGLVVDEDTGLLVLVDEAGHRLAHLRVGYGVGQLVYHAPTRKAYVADRWHDRIIVVDVGRGLRVAATFPTPAEPYGLAMTRTGKTLLVSTIADRTLVGYDTRTHRKRWSARLGPEPRGVAISPDGKEAIVTMLTSNAVAKVRFEAKKPPRVSYTSITPRDATPSNGRGKMFVRNAFAATYLGHDVAVVSHQLSRPVADVQVEDVGTYGGGGRLPQVEHRLAFLEAGRGTGLASARADVHQPRALAYDGKRDVLYLAGLGSDEVMALENASQTSVKAAWQRAVSDSSERCGPSGLAVADNGDVLVSCAFSHRVVRLDATAHEVVGRSNAPGFVAGPALGRSRLTADAQRGKLIFHTGEDPRISGGGALACASCHPDGRADGLSWRIQGNTLQTPMLSGRIRGTHPYKWDGGDPTIEASLTNTVQRLGGSGLTVAEASDLRAFLDSMPRPRPPTPKDAHAVARGKELFFGTSGCADCHSGPRLTDRKKYDLSKDFPKVDTPSLIGLASSAPYYHDGSAQTLRAALMENGTIHDMGVTLGLEERQMDDLVAYLETL